MTPPPPANWPFPTWYGKPHKQPKRPAPAPVWKRVPDAPY